MRNSQRLIAALMLMASGQVPAVDVSVSSLEIFDMVGRGAPATPLAGQMLQVKCFWKIITAAGEEFHPPMGTMTGEISIDGKSLGKHGVLASFNYIESVQNWKAVAGKHRIRCALDATNLIAETDESNNSREVDIVVMSARAGAATSQPAVGIPLVLPNPNVKSCKTAVFASVQLDKSQFNAGEAPPDTGAVKMTLDLVASHAIGNYVHCEYRSIGKDIKLVYTYQCPNAHPHGSSHMYACDTAGP